MTRVLVLLLVLANAAYFAWSRGALKPWGMAPAPLTEPQRAQDQIEPAAVRLLAPASAPGAAPAPAPGAALAPAPGAAPASAPLAPPAHSTGAPGAGSPDAAPKTPPSTPPNTPASGAPNFPPTGPAPALAPASAGSAAAASGECLQAGPFTDPQWALLQDALRTTLPSTVWTVENRLEPARWIVYMGRYADAEAVRRKRGELSVLKVPTEPLRNPALEPGLSLGAHGSEAEAKVALEALGRRGVRTARVARERDEVRSHVVRVPDAAPALKPRLAGLQAMLAGKAFRPCDASDAALSRRPT